MTRGCFAGLLFLACTAAAACPLCLGAFQVVLSPQDLVYSERAMLVLPQPNVARLRVVEVVKGDVKPRSFIDFNDISRHADGALASGRPLLLLRDRRWHSWVYFGSIGVEHADWLRELAKGKRATDMTTAEWEAQVATIAPYLQQPEPLVAEIAYGELANAPYAALRSLNPQLDARAIRAWLGDPQRTPRRPTYTLLLGVAGDAKDADRLERQLDAAMKDKDATGVGAMLAADLELRGPSRMAWIDSKYIRDDKRTLAEVEAAVAALGVQGDANAVIPRARVIQSYRMLMKEHKDLTGYVAREFAEWGYWDAVPEYIALLKTKLPNPASRYAMLNYLSECPRADAKNAARMLAAEQSY